MLPARTQTGIASSEGPGVVADLSMTGAFIETQATPVRGSRMWLNIMLPDGNMLSSYVEVVRVNARGIGARFVRLDPDGPALLESALLTP